MNTIDATIDPQCEVYWFLGLPWWPLCWPF
jgi:hypothetical protein